MNELNLESAVISGLLSGGATQDAYDVFATLPEEAFSSSFLRRVYVEIKKQAFSSSLIDPIFIAEAMSGDGNTLANILELSKSPVWNANLKGYANKVSEYWYVRRVTAVINAGQQALLETKNHTQAQHVITGYQ